jgi:hypothetical protein
MSKLCRVEPECLPGIAAVAKAGQGNDWHGNGNHGFFPSYSPAQHSPAKFFCPIHLSAFLKYTVKGLEKFFGFFEKNSRFIVKFRKFFGFIFL